MIEAPAERSAALRGFFARYVATRAGVGDARIVEAFAAVPRERFAGPGPWSVCVPGHGYIETPDDDPAYLYQDTLIAIDKARGINIGEPSLHALCLASVAPREGESVLHVGAGVGYYTALLARLVGPSGRVHGLEIEPDLAARAAGNLADQLGVTVESRSGLDRDLPAVDIVYVSAGLPLIPAAWLDALRPGGRLIFPLQAKGGPGGMLRIERPPATDGVAWPARIVTPAGFIGCSGGQDEEAGRVLAAAFREHGWRSVRSLRRDGAPGPRAWVAGEGWWLSKGEPGDAAPAA